MFHNFAKEFKVSSGAGVFGLCKTNTTLYTAIQNSLVALGLYNMPLLFYLCRIPHEKKL